MYCPRCGMVNLDNAAVCESCGALLGSATGGTPYGPVRTSGAAVASLILGILAPVSCFLTALPAVICGIVGLVQVSKGQGRVKGTGLAVTGIVLPIFLGLFVMPLLLAILMPALAKTQDIAQRVVCGTNLKGVSTAIMVYELDYDALPTPEKWCDLLVEHADVSPEALQCPAAPPGRCHYAMNANVRTAGAEPPADMVLLFESTPGWNKVGGLDDVETGYHQQHGQQGCNVAFVDGHVEFVTANQIGQLRWTVEDGQ